MRLGVVFPGQGSQAVGMAADIAAAYPAAADVFARAERILGYDLQALITEGPDEKLRETVYAQPAIFVTNYALAVSAGPSLPVVVSAGHSFAEFCSLTLAGVLTFEVALALVQQRGLAMQEAADRAPGAMAAVLGLSAEKVREATAGAADVGRVRLANFNSPEQIVISGDAAAVARAGELASAAGAKRVVALNVSGAWHSELMDSARIRFAPYVERAPMSMPAFTVISNVDALPYTSVEAIRANLVRSVSEEVRWHETAERLVAQGVDAIVEFGGSAVLAPMLKRLAGAPKATHAGDRAGIEQLVQRLSSGSAA